MTRCEGSGTGLESSLRRHRYGQVMAELAVHLSRASLVQLIVLRGMALLPGYRYSVVSWFDESQCRLGWGWTIHIEQS
jgi:hypothetical protein